MGVTPVWQSLNSAVSVGHTGDMPLPVEIPTVTASLSMQCLWIMLRACSAALSHATAHAKIWERGLSRQAATEMPFGDLFLTAQSISQTEKKRRKRETAQSSFASRRDNPFSLCILHTPSSQRPIATTLPLKLWCETPQEIIYGNCISILCIFRYSFNEEGKTEQILV